MFHYRLGHDLKQSIISFVMLRLHCTYSEHKIFGLLPKIRQIEINVKLCVSLTVCVLGQNCAYMWGKLDVSIEYSPPLEENISSKHFIYFMELLSYSHELTTGPWAKWIQSVSRHSSCLWYARRLLSGLFPSDLQNFVHILIFLLNTLCTTHIRLFTLTTLALFVEEYTHLAHYVTSPRLTLLPQNSKYLVYLLVLDWRFWFLRRDTDYFDWGFSLHSCKPFRKTLRQYVNLLPS